MLVSAQTDQLMRDFGETETVEIMADNGYDAMDYSMFGLKHPEHPLNGEDWYPRIKALREAADTRGIRFNQGHAPFASYKAGDETYNKDILHAIRRSIEIGAVLGVDSVIVHPISDPDPDRQKELNLTLYHSIEDICAKYGVKAALENMWKRDPATDAIIHAACSRPEQFNEYADMLGRDNFTCCLDVGHCGLVGINAADMVRAMGGERVTALHIHDNDGLSDSHTLPFTLSMDWKSITSALHDINYSGIFTFEADRFILQFPLKVRPDASRLMLSVGRQLVRMIEEG